jgi:hypothetical protein
MAWIRRKKARAAPAEKTGALPVAKAPAPSEGPRRRQLSDGTVEEVSAAMGRSILVPADPRPRGIDVRASAPGWEGRTEFRRLLRGR